MLSNNMLERSRIIGGRTVLAVDCVLAGAEGTGKDRPATGQAGKSGCGPMRGMEKQGVG